MKVGTRILLSVSVLAVAGIVALWVQVGALGNAQREYEATVAHVAAVRSSLAALRQSLGEATVARHAFLLTGRASDRDAVLRAERRMDQIVAALRSAVGDAPTQGSMLVDLEHAVDSLGRTAGAEELNLASARARGEPSDAESVSRAVVAVDNQTAALTELLDRFDRVEDTLDSRRIAQSRELAERARARAATGEVTIAVVALFVAIALMTGIRTPMVELGAIAQRIAVGKHQKIQWRRRDEIGDLGRSIETMSETIGQRENELRQRSALVELDARLGAALNGARDVRSVTEQGLRILAQAMGAFAGVMFLRDSSRGRFVAEATFGAPREELVRDGFVPGEGLLGRAAATREPFVLRPAPDAAPRMVSATADRAAEAYFVYPVQQGEDVIAVLELACMAAPDPALVFHLDALVDTLGVALATALVARERDRLHDRLEAQYAEVRAREERLRTQSETLDHQARELARKNDALSRASEMKSQFIATMSHELRTPLNSILGFTDLLLQRSPTLGADDRKSLQEVRSAGRHLLSLINDILDLARIDAGRMILRRTTVAVGSIAREVTEVLRPQAESKGIALQVDAPNEAVVDADPSRLRQILLNLAGNAVKFTDRGAVTVRAVNAGERVRVEVVDTGPGIAQSDRAKLFLEFSQLDSSGRRHEGSGLGLAIARELVIAHGGEIGVESEPGIGSTFWFTLARAQASTPTAGEPKPTARAALPPPATTPPRGERAVLRSDARDKRRPRILLAEDHPRNARLIEAALAGEYQIDHVIDGAVAVEHALANPPDIVLLDLELPGLDGFEVARRLRGDARTAEVPIVAVTARALPADEARARAIGCNEFVSKPIDLARLRGVIRSMVGEKEAPHAPLKP